MAQQFIKRVAVSVLGTVSVLAFAVSAQADCNGTVCLAGGHTSHASHSAYNPPALSTWSATQTHSVGKVSAPTYANHSNYGSSSINYGSANNYGAGTYSPGITTVAPCPAGSTKQADGTCLSTSSSFSSSTVSTGSAYSSAPTYSSSSYGSGSHSHGSVASSSYAAQTYGSGSISSAFTTDYSTAPLTSSVVSGLGLNESLQATTCPVSVDNPNGAKVLGCYNVVKPQPKPRPVVRTVVRTVPTVYQVVRPIVYVRYPVPVCNTCCSPQTVYSRYGSNGFNASGFNGGFNGGNSCGW